MPMNPRLLRPLARLQAGTPASLLLHFNGNFTDSSPSNLTVTAEGEAATSTTQSKFGGASGYFDGDGDRLDIATGGVLAFGADDFTLELWCYFEADENNAEHVLFSQASPADSVGVALSIYQNDLMWLAGVASSWTFQRYPGGEHFAAGSVFAGQWNHIAVTRSGDTFRLFANGQVLDSYTDSLTLPDSNALASIGGRTNFGQYFLGYIDEVRIVKGLAVYDGDFVPPSAALLANATPYTNYQPYGTLLFSECDGIDLVGTYTDGEGGRYTEVLSAGAC